MNYTIREIKENEYKLLDDFLYEAIFIAEGTKPLPRNVTKQPELQVYISNFGKKDDHCLVAEVDGKITGMIWVRIMNDYGHVDAHTPSLAMSLLKEYRGLGIGTVLMQNMISLLRSKGYRNVSLSVQKENYAYKLYLKADFKVVDTTDEEYIMICNL